MINKACYYSSQEIWKYFGKWKILCVYFYEEAVTCQIVGMRQFGSPELRLEQLFRFSNINSLSSTDMVRITLRKTLGRMWNLLKSMIGGGLSLSTDLLEKLLTWVWRIDMPLKIRAMIVILCETSYPYKYFTLFSIFFQ